MPKKNNLIQHVHTVDPSEEWASGFEYFLRFRGIGATVLVEVLSSAALWTYVGVTAGIASIAVAASLTGMLYWTRQQILRSVKRDNQLHNVLHFTRDCVAEFQAIGRGAKSKLRERLHAFHQEIVEQIATFFRCTLNNHDIHCALRLVEMIDGVPYYLTYARSKGLEEIRSRQSVPLSSDEGLAQALRNKGTKGVFIINSIQSAADIGLWKLSPNDDLEDVRSLMVAPINSIENGGPEMVGILYVTARGPVFKKRHTLSLKAFADLLGLVYPILFAKMGSKANSY